MAHGSDKVGETSLMDPSSCVVNLGDRNPRSLGSLSLFRIPVRTSSTANDVELTQSMGVSPRGSLP